MRGLQLFEKKNSNVWTNRTTYCILIFSYAAKINILFFSAVYMMHSYEFICIIIVVTSDFSKHLFLNIENNSVCSTNKMFDDDLIFFRSVDMKIFQQNKIYKGKGTW